MISDSEKEKFNKLKELGAGDFEHLNGSLEEHFTGTRKLLADWGADDVLLDAGLYHAAYGTAGFEAEMVNPDRRDVVAEIIGDEAEAIVYLYCSCDRDLVWPQIGVAGTVMFKDRFNGQEFPIEGEELKQFCELTAANELEIALGNAVFASENKVFFMGFFAKIAPFLSTAAVEAIKRVFPFE